MADSGRIIINYGNFDTHAQQIDAKNKEMRETLNEIQKKINGLAGDYESNSAVTIREKITAGGRQLCEVHSECGSTGEELRGNNQRKRQPV